MYLGVPGDAPNVSWSRHQRPGKPKDTLIRMLLVDNAESCHIFSSSDQLPPLRMQLEHNQCTYGLSGSSK